MRRAEEPIKLATRTLPAGAYIVSNAQPTARMVRNLLDPKTEQSAEFIKKQEERRKMRLNDQIYDITAWNLPMLFDVELVTSPTAIAVKATPVPSQYDAPMPARPLAAGEGRLPDAVGFRRRGAVGGRDARRAFASAASAARSRTTAAAIRSAPRSSATSENPADLNARLAALAAKHGAELVPIDSTWVDEGTSLGSNDVARAQDAEGPAGVGHADADAVRRLDALRARAPLRPGRDRGAHQLARPRQLQRLRRDRAAVGQLRRRRSTTPCSIASRTGCARGGTLVTMAEATRWATGSNVGLLDTTALLKDGRPDVPPPSGAAGASGASGASARSAAAPKPGERSITTRRFSPIASGRRRSPAPSCASRSTPITGSPPATTARRR